MKKVILPKDYRDIVFWYVNDATIDEKNTLKRALRHLGFDAAGGN